MRIIKLSSRSSLNLDPVEALGCDEFAGDAPTVDISEAVVMSAVPAKAWRNFVEVFSVVPFILVH